MDTQALFNIAVTLAGFLGGWVLKVIFDAIKTLDNDVKQLNREVHSDFVKRDDFRESMLDVKNDMRHGFSHLEELIGAVFKRLESKADK